MKILILGIFTTPVLLGSVSAFGAYNPELFKSDLKLFQKKKIIQEPQLEIKKKEVRPKKELKADKTPKLLDLEELYFDKIETKLSAPKRKRSRE